MNMRYLILLSTIICFIGFSANAQMTGDCVFLQGQYVEVGVAPNGGYGSTLPAPASYHSFLTSPQTFYDPGAGTSTSSSNFLGFVADYGRDGWSTGTPPFWGDFYLPGTPQEGWAVEVAGTRSEAYIPFYSTGTTGYSVGATLTGTNTGYSSGGGLMKGYWIGNQGNLKIRQTTILDSSKLYFTVNVIMTNTGGTTLNNIYYMRTLDPDNEVTRSGSYTTNNTITYRNPNPGNKALVSAVGTGAYASNAYLGLGTKDCRAKAFIIDNSLIPGTYQLSQIYDESTTFLYSLGANLVQDVGVGLVYNIGNLAAGDSTTLTYAYILNAAYIDSALNATQPLLTVNGRVFDLGDTLDVCITRGDTARVALSESGFYDWSWTPDTLIADSTLPTNTITGLSSITGYLTYTITGVNNAGSCDSVIHIIPIARKPIVASVDNPDTTICYGNSVLARVSGAGSYNYSWSPALGVSNTASPTPLFTPSVTTTYVLTVSSSDSRCPPVKDSFTIYINNPIITSTSFVNPSVCGYSDGSITLYGLATGYPDTLYYTKNGTPRPPTPVGVSSAGTIVIVGLSAGTYTNIRVKVGGCFTNTVGPIVLRNPPPQRISVDSNYIKTCVGVPVLINTHVTPAGTYSYTWTPPSYLSSATSSSVIATPPVAGDVTYTVTVNPGTDATCASDTFVTVHTIAPFILNNRDTAICLRSSVLASITGTTEMTYRWSPWFGVSDTTFITPTITPTTSGTYVVTGSYAHCPDQTASFYIEVDTPARIQNFTDSICLHMGVTYDVTVPGTSASSTGADYYTYEWHPGVDLTDSMISNPRITPVATGVNFYAVNITPHASSCQVTNFVTLFVLPDTISIHPTDSQICAGSVVQVVGSGDPLFAYQWLPTAGIPVSNVLNALIKADTSATYVVHAYFRGCPDITDTLHLDVQPNPSVYIGGNRFLCEFDTLRIDASVSPAWYSSYQYHWTPAADLDDSTSATTIFRGNATTKLYLTVTTTFGCRAVDSTVVTVYSGNFATLTPTKLAFCPHDDTVLIPAGPAGTSYHWYPSLYISDSLSATPRISPLTSQVYTVVATTINGCTDTFNFTTIVYPGAVVSVEDSVRIYPGQSYHIQPITNCSNLTWFPPQGLDNYLGTDPTATPEVSTVYHVIGVTENGCRAADSIMIFVSDESIVRVPNAFVPGSGSNGKFRIIQEGAATLNHLRIYNRWGNLLFETKDITEGWDGNYNGTPQPFGVYVYEIEAVSNTGKIFRRQGNLTLIR